MSFIVTMNSTRYQTPPRKSDPSSPPRAPEKPRLERITNDYLSHDVEYVHLRAYWREHFHGHLLLEYMDSLSPKDKTEVYEFLMCLTDFAHELEFIYYIHMEDDDTTQSIFETKYGHIISAFKFVCESGSIFLDASGANELPAHFCFSWAPYKMDTIVFHKHFEKLL